MAESESGYQVGPGRPPLHTRFQKGQSGNPGGRSAKSLPALDLSERRKLGRVHQLDALEDGLAHQVDARLEFRRIALVGVERAPQRQPLLADPAARFDMGLEARLTVAVEVARHRLRIALREGVVRCRDAQAMQVGKAFEHRAHRIARPFGDPCSRRHLRIFAQQCQVGFDDQLLGSHAPQAATIDPSGCGRCYGQGTFGRLRIFRTTPEL